MAAAQAEGVFGRNRWTEGSKWIVKATSSKLQPGDHVLVTKRSGQTSLVPVGKRLSTLSGEYAGAYEVQSNGGGGNGGPRFTKIDGEWGIATRDQQHKTGDQVLVAKRNGDSRSVLLGEQVGSGDVNLFLIAKSPEGTAVTEPGVFELEDGRVFVVKPTRDGERLYANQLIELRPTQGDRLTEEGEHVRYETQYAKGMMRFIREEDRMSVDRAKELALRYGRCLNCGRKLEVAESVERGIGPVCIKRFKGYEKVEVAR